MMITNEQTNDREKYHPEASKQLTAEIQSRRKEIFAAFTDKLQEGVFDSISYDDTEAGAGQRRDSQILESPTGETPRDSMTDVQRETPKDSITEPNNEAPKVSTNEIEIEGPKDSAMDVETPAETSAETPAEIKAEEIKEEEGDGEIKDDEPVTNGEVKPNEVEAKTEAKTENGEAKTETKTENQDMQINAADVKHTLFIKAIRSETKRQELLDVYPFNQALHSNHRLQEFNPDRPSF
jgi:SERRATE/Ars2, N-terminal domain